MFQVQWGQVALVFLGWWKEGSIVRVSTPPHVLILTMTAWSVWQRTFLSAHQCLGLCRKGTPKHNISMENIYGTTWIIWNCMACWKNIYGTWLAFLSCGRAFPLISKYLFAQAFNLANLLNEGASTSSRRPAITTTSSSARVTPSRPSATSGATSGLDGSCSLCAAWGEVSGNRNIWEKDEHDEEGVYR